MKRTALFLVVTSLLVAACGGGNGVDTTAPPDTGVPVTTTRSPEQPNGRLVLSPTEGVVRAEPAPDAPIADLATGFNDAGFALWRTQPMAENLVFSSTSIGHALLMARAAADSATGSAIDAVFGLPEGGAAHEAWNAAEHQIAVAADAEDEVTVRIADRIWPRIDVTPDQNWVDLLVAQHGATTEALDFVGEPVASRDEINSWVGEQTEGLIPELLPEGFITPQTVLVLTDAIYFEAQWQTVFGKYSNVSDVFTRLDGTTVEAEYLRELELGDLRGEGDGFAGAEIPYAGGEFSMLVIVPDEGRFEEMRDRLSQDLLDEINATFTTGPYELLVPKWDTSTQIDLIPWLTEIGAAPGSYPAISPAAFLDAGVHGADIAVDEWGTVAAAATALGFAESGPPEPEITVRADRPFYYLIRHRPSGLVLFAGQVTDPTA